MLEQLLAPACAIAALTFSSTALAAEDPAAPEPEVIEPEGEASEGEASEVEASEPVTLAPKVAAGQAEGSVGLTRTVHGGRLAIGAARTLAGLNGINFRYYITDHFHLGVNLGVATFSYREPDPADAADCGMDQTSPNCDKNVRTLAYIGSSLEGIYWILGKPAGNMPFQADFGLGGRIGFQHIVNATDIPNDLDDPLQFTFEIPLAIQLNFGENFAIMPEFGAAFRWNPGTRLQNPSAMPPDTGDSNPGFTDPNGTLPPGSTSGPGFGFEINDHIGLFGGASLLYHF